MDSDQGAPAPSQTAGNGNAAVLLGLYLLLLAFFILLVAISRIVETRSSAALNSVNGAFSAAVEATAPTAFAPIVTGPIVEIEEFQGRIRAAVEEALPVAEVLVVQSGRVLRVRISMNVAFVRDEARLSRAMPPLLARLAGAMGPAAPGIARRDRAPRRRPRHRRADRRWRCGGRGCWRESWSMPASRRKSSPPGSMPTWLPWSSALWCPRPTRPGSRSKTWRWRRDRDGPAGPAGQGREQRVVDHVCRPCRAAAHVLRAAVLNVAGQHR